MDEGMHVLGLSPAKQIALKLVLGNFYKCASKEWLAYVQENPTADELRARQKQIVDSFDIYCEIAEVCTSKHATGKNGKLIMVAPISMRYLQTALKSFNTARNELHPVDVTKVLRELNELKKLVDESSKYQYTDVEIKRQGLV